MRYFSVRFKNNYPDRSPYFGELQVKRPAFPNKKEANKLITIIEGAFKGRSDVVTRIVSITELTELQSHPKLQSYPAVLTDNALRFTIK